jgi:hypothetical protein
MFPSTILWRANYCRLHSTSPSSRNQPIGRFRPPVYGPGPEGPAPAAPRQTRRRPHRLSLHLATIRARLQVARKRNGPGQSSAAQTRGVTGWRALVEHSAGTDGGVQVSDVQAACAAEAGHDLHVRGRRPTSTPGGLVPRLQGSLLHQGPPPAHGARRRLRRVDRCLRLRTISAVQQSQIDTLLRWPLPPPHRVLQTSRSTRTLHGDHARCLPCQHSTHQTSRKT